MNARAQTVSTDALIAVALFMIIALFFFSVSGVHFGSKKIENLQDDVTDIVSAVSSNRNTTFSFVKGTKIDESVLQAISNISYDDLKDTFGVTSDFCIHFEDDEGNVINISVNKTGLGSGFVTVGGSACG